MPTFDMFQYHGSPSDQILLNTIPTSSMLPQFVNMDIPYKDIRLTTTLIDMLMNMYVAFMCSS